MDVKASSADALVIFGITGDLARKMTFRSLYRLERQNRLPCPIIGVARADWSAAQLKEHARASIEESGERLDEKLFERFAARLSMVRGDYQDRGTYDRLAASLASRPAGAAAPRASTAPTPRASTAPTPRASTAPVF